MTGEENRGELQGDPVTGQEGRGELGSDPTTRQERRYRRLLWAYPGPYRRRHGAEIVTTLLEMVEDGCARPSAAQRLHLVACGIRQRFRLPARRPVAVVAAALAAIALGALGAAGGTWLGWQTAATMPSGDEIRGLSAAMAGGRPSDVPVYPWRTAMNGPAATARMTIPGSYSAERVRTALTAAGWRTTALTGTTAGLVVDITKDPMVDIPARFLQFEATKDGLSLDGDSLTSEGSAAYGLDPQIDQRIEVWADETPAVRPLTVAGLVLGTVAGWLLTAALAYRIRESGRAGRRAAVALGLTAVAAAVAPVFRLYCGLYRVLTYDGGAPNPYIADSPADRLPAGLVPASAGLALIAVAALAVIAARGSRVRIDPTGPEPVTSA
jgi:hypothetical protein